MAVTVAQWHIVASQQEGPGVQLRAGRGLSVWSFSLCLGRFSPATPVSSNNIKKHDGCLLVAAADNEFPHLDNKNKKVVHL